MKNYTTRQIAILGSGLAVAVAAVTVLPWLQGLSWVDNFNDPAAHAEFVNEVRRTNASIAGGLLVAIGLHFGWLRVKAADEANNNARLLRRIESKRQITESYVRAVEQLSQEHVAIRLGGIYSLDRIARESADLHWTVIEVLCALVRERRAFAMAPGPLDHESVAILKVIAGRNHDLDKESLMLNALSLHGAEFAGSVLLNAQFFESDLFSGTFRNSDLGGASFRKASLEAALFVGCNLTGASFRDAKGGVSFFNCNLDGADFSHAELEDSVFDGCVVTARTRFAKTDLKDAHLIGDYREANFRSVTGFSDVVHDGAASIPPPERLPPGYSPVHIELEEPEAREDETAGRGPQDRSDGMKQ